MEIKESRRGIEVVTPQYRLFLEREGGYAVREVEIMGIGRLDRFDRPGEGPHPTCMYFDNCTVNNSFQLGHYGKENHGIEAAVQENSLYLEGTLIPITDTASGTVSLKKKMVFEDDAYKVALHLGFEDVGLVDYASIWWDVNDTWLTAMRSSAGVFMPLRVGIGDAYGSDLRRTWRPMDEMDRGAGIWMEMLGEGVSVLAAYRSSSPEVLYSGGMKYWDGPDDAESGPGVSHGCINLDLINSELSRTSPLDTQELRASYNVFLSGPTVLRFL